MSKVSVVPINTVKLKKPDNYKAVKRKPRKESNNKSKQHNVNNKNIEVNKTDANTQTLSREIQNSSNLTDVDCVIIENNNNTQTLGRGSPSKHYLESRSAASRRYRERLKETMRRQSEENKQLRESNKRLTAEKAELKLILTEHLKKCPIGDELREIRQRLKKTTTV
ncbi:unnamed protein product [Parnassius apollo]|uniref:(apollo) hypothetical protein n=1 Tax=Parnassius apollo TaxID=110799 RepID=A0A8S3WAN5_PARAO|nr:unnamed protein product [Parnassius apollo]